MAYASHYSHIFDIPVAKPGPGKRRARHDFRDRKRSDLIDLEFSDYGRDPRFPSGWFIVPVLLVASVVALALLAL